jgi:hypothetical protein
MASQACKTPNSVNENLGTSNAKDESAAPKLYLSIVIVLVVLKNQPRSRLKLGCASTSAVTVASQPETTT